MQVCGWVKTGNGKVISGDIDFNLINPGQINVIYHGAIMPPGA